MGLIDFVHSRIMRREFDRFVTKRKPTVMPRLDRPIALTFILEDITKQTISDINKEINATRAELKEIKRQEEEEKAAKEAEKAAKKAAQQDEKAAKEAEKKAETEEN